eukprot:TRINITY_DN57960_c0_g1_i1.p1 TRINITY_DN57960_c0_g1~~TRINITY_DN57960_c0_g1_i1.p1  ORF type:complete len:384 (+),score=155.60 TRINITY_DN57960_c0_g1_i1:86-1153(+)
MGPEDILRDAVLKNLIMGMQEKALLDKDDEWFEEILDKLSAKATQKLMTRHSKLSEEEVAVMQKVHSNEEVTRREQIRVLHLWARGLMPVRNFDYVSKYPAKYLQVILRIIDPDYANRWPVSSSEMLSNLVHHWYNVKYGPLCVINRDPVDDESEVEEEEEVTKKAVPKAKPSVKKAVVKKVAKAPAKKAPAADRAVGKKAKAAAATATAATGQPKEKKPRKQAPEAEVAAPTTPIVEEVAPDTPVDTTAVPVVWEAPSPGPAEAAEPAAEQVDEEVPEVVEEEEEDNEEGLAKINAVVNRLAKYFRMAKTDVSNITTLSDELDESFDDVLKAAKLMHKHETVFFDENMGAVYMV